MDATEQPEIGRGELVAYVVPPGPRWVGIIEEHAARGIPFLPIDHRLTDREQRRIVDRARPTRLVIKDDTVLFAEGVRIDPRRSWAVVGSSGVTGEPKLAELSATALTIAAELSLATLHRLSRPGATIRTDDPWVCCLSPAHVGGLLVLLRARRFGAPVVVHERFDVDRLLREAPEGAHVALVPTMVRRLVEARVDLSRFGVLLVGGGGLASELRDAATDLGATVVSTYGLTETCGGVVYDGSAFEGTEVRIGEGGAVEVRGPTLMEGYRLDPTATAAAFTIDGWLRTGDLGSLSDGTLVVHGRADDAIRTGAETVWPDEVEAILRRHAKVADVAIAGRPDADWGSHVGAWIVPVDPADPPSLGELRAAAREHLSGYKAPRELILVRRLPRTASGKLRRSELPPA